MKKMITLFLMLFIISFLNGQKATITISHTVTYNSISVLPDSIMVTNMTQGYYTTLYGSDTTLVLDYTVGMNEYQNDNNAFVVMPNYPNPFSGLTYFDVIIPEAGQVAIKVYDVVSKEVASLSANYTSGKHKFLFVTGKEGLYLLNVVFENKTSSIKMFSSGNASEQGCELSYISANSFLKNKLSKAVKSFGYVFGDELRSIVYYQNLSDTSIYIPTQDTLIIVEFQNTPVCPASFTDIRDNHIYTAVLIGSQCWMAENLAYLPAVYPSDSGSNISPYYYVYDYQGTDINAAKATINYQTYGVLYNWPAAMAGQGSSNSVPSGVQGICPIGWHLPSDEEWKILEGEVDSQYGYPDPEWDDIGWRGSDAGGNLKETGYSHWDSPNYGATNSSRFTALPGGGRGSGGLFGGLGYDGYFWSSTEHTSSFACGRNLYYYNAGAYRNYYFKTHGSSCRCLKD